jgi:hypothetical protein
LRIIQTSKRTNKTKKSKKKTKNQKIKKNLKNKNKNLMKKTKGLYRIFYLIIYYEARGGRTEGILENEKSKCCKKYL